MTLDEGATIVGLGLVIVPATLNALRVQMPKPVLVVALVIGLGLIAWGGYGMFFPDRPAASPSQSAASQSSQSVTVGGSGNRVGTSQGQTGGQTAGSIDESGDDKAAAQPHRP